jgi:hypothetical protein
MRASKKAQQRLKARQIGYDDMVAKNPELKQAYHRPGSLKK